MLLPTLLVRTPFSSFCLRTLTSGALDNFSKCRFWKCFICLFPSRVLIFFLVMVQEYAVTSSTMAAGAAAIERVLQSSFSRQYWRGNSPPRHGWFGQPCLQNKIVIVGFPTELHHFGLLGRTKYGCQKRKNQLFQLQMEKKVCTMKSFEWCNCGAFFFGFFCCFPTLPTLL